MAFRLIHDGHAHEIEVVRRRPRLVLRIDGVEHIIASLGSGADGDDALEIDKHAVAFVRARDRDRQFIRLHGHVHEFAVADELAEEGGGEALDEVRSPMPGLVVALTKAVGESVARGETVMMIESMKMQLSLSAPRDGILASLSRGLGDTVDKDEIVARLEIPSVRA